MLLTTFKLFNFKNFYQPINFILKSAFIFLIISVLLLTTYGQSNYQASRGGSSPNVSPGTPIGSYALSGFESVNPYSGKLNFSLPLLKVGGRGSTGYTVNLKLQKSFSIEHNIYDPNTYLPGGETYEIQHNYYPTDQELGANIDIIQGPGIMKGRMSGTNRQYFLCGTQPCYDETLTRLTFEQSDGTQIEFRDVLYGGKAITSFDATGSKSRGTDWISIDGTNARFVSDSPIYDHQIKDASGITFFPSGTLYLPNGTKYIILNGGVQEIIDVNGNKATTTKDSLGREISFTQNMNPTTYEIYDKTITYKGTNGVARNVKIDYASLESRLADGYEINALFELPPSYIPQQFLYNPGVVSNVELPDGRKYEFKYNDFGELAEVKLPTGGKIEYIWQAESGLYTFGGGPQQEYSFQVYRRVQKRRVYENNVLESEIVYGYPDYQDFSVTVQTYQNNSGTLVLTNTVKHFYADTPIPGWHPIPRPTEDSHWMSGKELRTEIYDASGTLLRKTVNSWQTGTPLAANPAGTINVRLAEVTETLSDTNQVSRKTFSYDQYNNQTDVYEYDYGTAGFGALKRHTHTDYLTDPNYTSLTGAYLLGLPTAVKIYGYQNGQEFLAAQNEIKYDETSLTPRTNVIGWTDPQRLTRGNVTKTRSWVKYGNEAETWLETKAEYDVLGNVVKTIDAKNNTTTIDYADKFGTPDNEVRSNTAPSYINSQNVTVYPLNGQSTFAFPTSGTNALNWTVGYTQFDYFTGQAVNTEDINGVISKTIYNDPLDRPTQTVSAIGTDFERQSNIIYHDAITDRRVEVKSDLNELDDNLLKSESFYDGLGRTIESRRYESDGGYITTKSIPFAVITDTETQIQRVATQVTNPYRPLAGEQPVWTTSLVDALGRNIKTITPDGAKVKTEYSGNTVTVTDQALKQRRSITNALGQLIRIDEPFETRDQNGNVISVTLGTVEAPAQPTYYKYNTLGKMTEVTQGVQKRHFLYDSLGRLLRVRQPEQQVNSALNLSGSETTNTQWTAGFSYDNNGNLLTATDAKNVTITNAYDALNRAVTRSYSDSVTPPIAFSYDEVAVPYSKGKLTKVSSSISETRYTSYDIMGRMLSSQQATDGQTYSSSYKYNLTGMLTEQTYPSGRVVKDFLATDGKLTGISSKVWNGQFKTYATNINYTATGVIKHLQLGNGLWESAKMNSRDQVRELNMGNSPTDGSKWQLKYDYGEFDVNGNVDATKNSGNIAKQTISMTGMAQPFVQTYKYDSLDRISEAKETNTGNQTWKQTFGYDLYGNRTGFTQDIGGQQMPINNLTLPTVDANTNRFQTGQGYGYDAGGNLIQDASGMQFTFNGENKQTEVKDGSNNVIGRYYYDGNGKRVKKITASEIVIFVYDGMGKLAAEYSTATPVSNPTTNYTATDPLGSPRVITNKLGEIVSRRDFMPFGEQLAPDATYRTASLKYNNADNIRQKFTGYQRDDETGLDFAEARYYNNHHGRFTAVDPLLASGKSADPQTFNRYVYTMNRPLILTDPTGLQSGRKPDKSDDNEVIRSNTEVNKDAPKILDVKVTYLDKDQYGTAVPIGGKFQITYKYLINQPKEGTKPEDYGSIEATTRDKTTIKEGKVVEKTTEESPNATFTTTENVERAGESKVTVTGAKNEAVIVTKTETFIVKPRANMSPNSTGSINFQVVVKDPQVDEKEGNRTGTPRPRTVIYTTRDNEDKAIEIRNQKVRN